MPDSDQPLPAAQLHRPPHVHQDFTPDTALRIIGQWPLIPVVHRANFEKHIGIVSPDDIMRTYPGAGLSEDIREEEPTMSDAPAPAPETERRNLFLLLRTQPLASRHRRPAQRLPLHQRNGVLVALSLFVNNREAPRMLL